MVGLRRLTLAALVLAAGLVPVGPTNGGPVKDWFFPADGASPEYSSFRYWTPGLAHLHDDVHGPKISVYPPDRHPEIPSTMTILMFKCPCIDPAATIIEPPTPPPTSKFRY